MAAHLVFRDEMQGAVRSEWSFPFASTATQQIARKTSLWPTASQRLAGPASAKPSSWLGETLAGPHAGFDKNGPYSTLCSLASYRRIRPTSHALNLGHSCQNAAHGGFNQRFLKAPPIKIAYSSNFGGQLDYCPPVGAKIIKKYPAPTTPAQRLISYPGILDEHKQLLSGT